MALRVGQRVRLIVDKGVMSPGAAGIVVHIDEEFDEVEVAIDTDERGRRISPAIRLLPSDSASFEPIGPEVN